MGAITVRNLPPELARLIRQKAKKEKISLNRAVIGLLEEAVGVGKRKEEVLHYDLDRFFGCWSKEEYEEFNEALREQRQIDPEMWK
jgi:DNA-binding ferritin-like protein (Dps family)